MQGTIIKGIGGFYFVKTGKEVFRCKARGIFKKDNITPMVGDLVELESTENGFIVINSIIKRKNEFIRPPVSNVDCFIVVTSAAKPETNFSVVDRFLVMAESNDAEAVICINKVDIAEDAGIRSIESVYENLYPVVCVSAVSGQGTDRLKKLMGNGKFALAGPSGAGKSTLLSALQPQANVETGEISRKTSRGKHTTRHTEIFELEAGVMVYDTPGFTSFDTPDVEADELQHMYPEMAELYGKCRYKNCVHIKEAGCAVAAAATAGQIHESRYGTYREIYNEIISNRKF